MHGLRGHVIFKVGLGSFDLEMREAARLHAVRAHAACMTAIGRALGVNDKTIAYGLRPSSNGKQVGKLAHISVVEAPSDTIEVGTPLALEIGSGMRLGKPFPGR